MSLNNISLPPQLIVDLYSGVLIESDATVVPVKPGVKYLGKNERNILVMVFHKNVAFLPDEELIFLTNVLSACKLALNDVAIVNWCNCTVNCEQLMEQLNSTQVLLFDLTPDAFGLPVNFPAFQVQAVNGRTFLHAASLTEIEQNVELKKQLWSSLKRLRNL